MDRAELERITAIVAKEVAEAIRRKEAGSACCSDTAGSMYCPDAAGGSCGDHAPCGARQCVLVIGKPRKEIPEQVTRKAVLFDLSDYEKHQDVLRYDRIYIASLSVTQLCDIAQGRAGDPASCAVVHGLLAGIETLMPEDAPSYKRYAGKGSTALYRLIESYERTLRSFGVKVIGQDRDRDAVLPPPKPPKYMAPKITAPAGSARPNFSCLITEEDALRLSGQGKEVILPAGSILTPSAKDVFAHAGIAVTVE